MLGVIRRGEGVVVVGEGGDMIKGREMYKKFFGALFVCGLF